MKDAYLIIAHKQWELLKILIQSLDYEQHDIYIHIDKKTQVPAESLAKYAKKIANFLLSKI